MKNKLIIGLFAVAFAIGCSTANKLPNTEVITNTAQTIDIAQGKILYEGKCGRCHSLYEASKFTAAEWRPIVDRMAPKAKITDEQKELVYAYLTTP